MPWWLLLLLLPLLFYLQLYQLGSHLVVRDRLRPADAIVVMAGDQTRPVHAAALYREGYAPELLLTNLPLPSLQGRRTYLNQIGLAANQHGVPREAMTIVPGVGVSTYQEVFNLLDFVQPQGYERLIVVTSPSHTRRTRMIFGDVFVHADIEISVQPVAAHPYRPRDWFMTAQQRRDTWAEYVKLALYRIGIR